MEGMTQGGREGRDSASVLCCSAFSLGLLSGGAPGSVGRLAVLVDDIFL